ncbi:hypothetical protein RclHR1_03190017 [Rhizophagus clarus]|uniref:Uncharacterized protein n=1 Tax=Rhizophagus clarus TaxID=94130 RepID=A0A2Z6R7Z5_9GLOM|nr:hypothetical protein RclHR1_03190017 [Rhizophagus clarus]
MENSGEKFNTFSSWINFLKIKKVFKGVRSAITTVFFEPNSSGLSLVLILRTNEQVPYWKVHNSASIVEVMSLVKTNITSKQEFFGIGMREIVNGIGITFFEKECKVEKDLIIRWQDNLISYDMNISGKSIKKINGIETRIAIERNFFEINNTIEYVFKAEICPGQITKDFEQVVKFRDANLVNNQKNSNNTHEVFATLENQGQSNEAYRRIDCDCQIAQEVANKVTRNEIDISTFSPIFQELIRIQSNQAKEIRYHPMFLRWAISVYSRGGKTAYKTIKSIMRLPSISTLKSYINESQQQSEWQNKTAYHILQKITVENINIHGQAGFFSHDSFKIQKGLLWSQRDNCYVDYLDFEDEKNELQSFMMKCEKELQEEMQVENLHNSDHERGIATQVYQIIWHLATCKFAYSIAYYEINTLTAHEINKILFQLAANLECLGDTVEVNTEKDNYEKAKIIAANLDRSKFTVCLLGPPFSNEFHIDHNLLRPPMPNNSNWNINDFCEFKNPEDNK